MSLKTQPTRSQPGRSAGTPKLIGRGLISEFSNVLSRWPFSSLTNFKLNSVPFVDKCPVKIVLVYKNITASSVGLDESISLGRIKPFYRSYCHDYPFVSWGLKPRSIIAPKNRPKLNNTPYQEPIDDYHEIMLEKSSNSFYTTSPPPAPAITIVPSSSSFLTTLMIFC